MKLIIAKDGSGDFTSLQAAVDALPADARGAELFLKKGEYRERIVIHRDGVRLVGEDREGTVITASGCAKDLDADGSERGTFLSFTVIVTGTNVELENLTKEDWGIGYRRKH